MEESSVLCPKNSGEGLSTGEQLIQTCKLRAPLASVQKASWRPECCWAVEAVGEWQVDDGWREECQEVTDWM
jgi:hypothetical protein